MRLPRLHILQPRLSPPSLPLRRDPREHAVDLAQSPLVWRADAGAAGGDRRRRAGRFRRRLPRRAGARSRGGVTDPGQEIMSGSIYENLKQLGHAVEAPASPEEAVLEKGPNPQCDLAYLVRVL